MSSQEDLALKIGLPQNLNAERYALASVLYDPSAFDIVAESIDADMYAIEKHRRIWLRMLDLRARGVDLNTVSVAEELNRQGQLESIADGAKGGLTYLLELGNEMPELGEARLRSYLGIIREKYSLRCLIFTAQRTIKSALLEEASSEEITASLGKQIEKIQVGAQRESEGKNPEQIILESPGGLQGFLDPSTRKRGLPIPIKRLDFMMNGLQDGEMFIIGARPGQGKTCFALNMVEELTVDPRRHLPGAIFSLEMKGSSLLTRLICARGRVDKGRYRAGFLNREERSRVQVALSDITDAPLWIYERASMTAEDIDREVRRLHREQGLRYFMVDHLQLCATKERFENQNLKVGSITRRFHILSKDCNIPSVVLSQLGRASEKRPGAQSEPQLGDLLDSGRVEADADSVMFIFRPEVYKKTEELKGVAKLILAKQREGECSTIECRFLGNIGRFENAAGDAEEEPEYSEPPPPSFHEKEEESRW